MRNLHLDVDSGTNAPRLVRHTLRTWLEPVDCNDDMGLDMTIVVNELVTDAVRNDASPIRTHMTFGDCRLRVDVHDDRPPGPMPAADLLERVAEQTTDNWSRTTALHQTHTWAEIRCSGGRPARSSPVGRLPVAGSGRRSAPTDSASASRGRTTVDPALA